MNTQYELKIVGLHYAANPTYNKDMGIVPEMEKHTVDVLRELEKNHPRVLLMPEPTNPMDPLAIMARVRGNRIGYVARHNAQMVQNIFKQTGKKLLTGTIHEVEVKERGNMTVIIDIEDEFMKVNEAFGAYDWSEWKYDLPLLGDKEKWMAREEAEYMIDEVLYPFEEENMEELEAYLDIWIQNSLYDMSVETIRFCNRYIECLGAHPDARLRKWAERLEKHRTAFCGDKRTTSRMAWWNSLQDTEEMELLWNKWIHHSSYDLRKGLYEIDSHLRRLPTDLYTYIGEPDKLFSALFYHDVPRNVLWTIYSAMLLRERICKELDTEMKPLPEDADEYGEIPGKKTVLKTHSPLPDVLTTPEATVLLEKCRMDQLLDEWGQPHSELTYIEKGMLAKDLSEKLNISKPWCIFGNFWGIKPETLRTSYNQALDRRKSLKFQDRLKKIV